ncbi:MAG: acyltransferase [Flavobacterium sp.]|nr:MAG: acyltransferase [Flavobacterium sp.]
MAERNYLIDFLRFAASSWVVLFHLNEGIPLVDNGYRSFAKLGYLGVPIFFVVSGYCIALAAQSSKNSIDFLTKRFFRIFPCYWLSLLIVLIGIGFYILLRGQNSLVVLPRSLKDVSATILLLTNPFSSVPTINWVYWSLTVEIFFYLAVALSLLLKSKNRNFFILGLSALSFFPRLFEIPGLFFLQQWPSFGIGLALYFLQIDKKISVMPLTILLLNSTNLIVGTHPAYYSIVSFLTLGAIAISIYWKDIPNNFFSKLGDYSYAVYLIHVPLGIYALGIFKTATIQVNVIYNVIYDLSMLTLCIGISTVIFKYLELPAIKFGKKVAKRLNKKRSSLITVQA